MKDTASHSRNAEKIGGEAGATRSNYRDGRTTRNLDMNDVKAAEVLFYPLNTGGSDGRQKPELSMADIVGTSEDDHLILRVPVEREHGVQVALSHCGCTTSTKTQAIRNELQSAIKAAQHHKRTQDNLK